MIAIAQKRRGTVLAVAPMSGRKSKEKDESGEKRAVARALCKRVLPVTQQFSYRSNPINGVLRSMQLKSAFSSALWNGIVGVWSAGCYAGGAGAGASASARGEGTFSAANKEPSQPAFRVLLF